MLTEVTSSFVLASVKAEDLNRANARDFDERTTPVSEIFDLV
jgi:hypothetical protein